MDIILVLGVVTYLFSFEEGVAPHLKNILQLIAGVLVAFGAAGCLLSFSELIGG